jgi:hypothetical protein
MKNLIIFGSLLFYSQLLLADAESDYKNLCSYDQKWCRKLKNSDGTFVKPKKEIVLLLKELGPTIEKHAKTLGVDPRAVAGAIMAENSLNVSISDDVQDLLVKIGVAKKGEVLGKRFTYGLGQLNFTAAREAEDYAAKLENRAPVSDTELSNALLIPERAVYYVAAVLRKCQDDYKNQGIDIAGKPEILTTLYNLGHSDIKSSELKKSGNNPKPNYFGFFVQKYQSELSFLTSKAEPLKAEVRIAKPIIKEDKPVSDSKEIKLAVTKSMPLYSAPPTCATTNEYGAADLRAKYDSLKAFTVSVVAEKEKTFKVIAPSIDCETNTWELIKLSSGELGWIKKDDLEKTTSKILVPKMNCTQQVDVKCANSIKEKLKDQLALGGEVSKTEIYVTPKSNAKKAAFKKPDWQCQEKEEEEAMANPPSALPSSGSGGYYPSVGSGMYGSPMPMVPANKIGKAIHTDAVMNDLIKLIDQKKKEAENFYKAPLNEPINPYSGIPFDAFKEGIEKCKNRQVYNLKPCQLDFKEVNKLLAAIDVSKKPSKDDRLFLITNMGMIPMGIPFASKDDIVKKVLVS